MQNFEYFNLREAGDTAVVRILHSGVHTIEIKNVHTIMEGTKRRIVNCTGQGCPICASNNAPYERAYIHLWDYTDNKEKIWARTVKILEQFDQIAKSWGNLSNCVLQITRKTKEFPTYDVIPVNPQAYPVPNATVDEKVAYRCYNTRSAEELAEFIRTGILPAHIKKDNNNGAVPKSTYNQNNGFAPQFTPQFAPPIMPQVNPFAQTPEPPKQYNESVQYTPSPNPFATTTTNPFNPPANSFTTARNNSFAQPQQAPSYDPFMTTPPQRL